jgi:hypothetical protein
MEDDKSNELKRKLNVKEAFILSRILKEVNAKSYIEYLLRTMDKYKVQNNKAQAELARMEKNKSPDEIEKWKSENIKSKEEIDNLLGIDMVAFVIENIDLARNSVYELISSYSGLNIDEIENIDLDIFIGILSDMFKSGLPETIKKLLKKNSGGKLDFLANQNVLRI